MAKPTYGPPSNWTYLANNEKLPKFDGYRLKRHNEDKITIDYVIRGRYRGMVVLDLYWGRKVNRAYALRQERFEREFA